MSGRVSLDRFYGFDNTHDLLTFQMEFPVEQIDAINNNLTNIRDSLYTLVSICTDIEMHLKAQSETTNRYLDSIAYLITSKELPK